MTGDRGGAAETLHDLHRLVASLPSGVSAAACEISETVEQYDWYPEAAEMQSVAIRRRREFLAGRRCARQALARLGHPGAHVPIGTDRAPVWPSGFVGSISHSSTRALAVVASSGVVTALGVDCETRGRVTPGLASKLLRDDERRNGGLIVYDWPTLVFSAKEACFKAWYPSHGQMLDFHDVRLHFSSDLNSFQAEIVLDGRVKMHLRGGAVHLGVDHVYTAAWQDTQI